LGQGRLGKRGLVLRVRIGWPGLGSGGRGSRQFLECRAILGVERSFDGRTGSGAERRSAGQGGKRKN
jgi:hypothetical protein